MWARTANSEVCTRKTLFGSVESLESVLEVNMSDDDQVETLDGCASQQNRLMWWNEFELAPSSNADFHVYVHFYCTTYIISIHLGVRCAWVEIFPFPCFMRTKTNQSEFNFQILIPECRQMKSIKHCENYVNLLKNVENFEESLKFLHGSIYFDGRHDLCTK